VPKSLQDAYVAGGAAGFYGAHFGDATARRAAVDRAARPLAPLVAEVVAEQNAALAPSAARDRNVAALRAGAAAVVTGQQVGLFLGPLYTLAKAVSAVAAARALTAECGRIVVPVFWLQTEDDDLAEIAECHVPRASGEPLTLRVPASSRARVSVAHLTLPPEVAQCIDALAAEIGTLPLASAHLDRIARHYCPGARWATAFAGLLGEIFATDGLVLVDPRDARLASIAAPLHRLAITDAEEIADALLARGGDLERAGFAPAVHVRAGAPLSFFHPRGVDGPRYRLVPSADGLAEVGGGAAHDRDSLLSILAADPLRFSTSVLLRPILQDLLLPTAVFVGGPAEVAYFAQIEPLYRHYGMVMPVVLPRTAFRLVESKTQHLLERLHLVLGDEARPEGALLAAAMGPAGESVESLSRRLLAAFDEELSWARNELESLAQGLDIAFEKTRASVAAAVAKLAAKVENARLHRDTSLVRDVRVLKAALYPCDTPQERFYGMSYFAARYGEGELVRAMTAKVEAFQPRRVDLYLDGVGQPQ